MIRTSQTRGPANKRKRGGRDPSSSSDLNDNNVVYSFKVHHPGQDTQGWEPLKLQLLDNCRVDTKQGDTEYEQHGNWHLEANVLHILWHWHANESRAKLQTFRKIEHTDCWERTDCELHWLSILMPWKESEAISFVLP